MVSLGDTPAPSPFSSPTRLPLPPVGNIADTLFRDTVAAGGLGTIRYDIGILRGFVVLRYAECRPLWLRSTCDEALVPEFIRVNIIRSNSVIFDFLEILVAAQRSLSSFVEIVFSLQR